ncbi:MAG: hypothetical protein R3C56_25240 [Pirellulaceae bacterium]
MLWIATTSGFAALGLIYVVFLKTDTWVASQALIVRDEANGAVMRLGRFESQTEMKAAQETILEMARNPQVLHDALTALGREPSWTDWLVGERPPTTSEIDDLARNGIQVRAPRGAELGTTEVIYLDVKNESPQRALKLNEAVCDALIDRLQQIRQTRANGILAELRTTKETAQEQLLRATERLTKMETLAGADLSDLRGMTDSNSGGSGTRQVLDAIKAELRQAELQLHQIQIDLKLAIESHQNPDQLLLTPSTLVNSQAGLKTLRDGLASATIATSQMKGRYTSTHPLVVASLQAETNIREQLRNELELSIQTLSKDSEIASERVKKLNSQRAQLESRLQNIAHIRADYANVASEVKSRNQQLQESERELVQAQASRDAALTSSLITRLDKPQLGEKPIGPGRSTILAGATVSGLFFGLGVVFLLAPLDGGASYGRRRFDYSGLAGRRATDRDLPAESRTTTQVAPATGSRRSEDPHPNATTPGTVDRRGAAPVHSTEIKSPNWAQPLQVTQKLAGVFESWKNSQMPIQPVPRPESKSRSSEHIV